METANTESPRSDRSIAQLVSNLASDAGSLVRKEVELARAEMSEKVSQVSGSVVTLVVGGVILFGGFLVLLDAAVYGLAQLMESYGLGLAALIVAVVALVLGGIIVAVGRSRLRAGSLAPRRTAESLRRDTEFVKEQVR